MVETTQKRPEGEDIRSKQQADLLEAALRQPGVKEFIEVYERFRPIEEAARSYRQAMSIKRVVSTTNTSGPVTRRTP